ncbi:MAG: response regulator [Gemmatimonadales bacterium]
MGTEPAGPIIIVNDHEWTARSVETLLTAAGHRTLRAFTGAQLRDLLGREQPDALILDVQLPDATALELLPRLVATGAIDASLPVILTTAGPSGRAMRLRAAEAGAWGFFGQPLDGAALLCQLRVFVDAYRATRAREAAVGRGVHTATTLAGRARELAAMGRRAGVPVACVTVELGEVTEPEEIAVAEALRDAGRRGDAVGRLGQGRLAVLAYGADAHGAARLVERLTETIGAVRADLRAVVTALTGRGEGDPAAGDSVEELLALALAAPAT